MSKTLATRTGVRESPAPRRRQRILSAPGGRARAYEIIMRFDGCPKTETAFYLKFQRLSDGEKKRLQTYYSLPDADWAVFMSICRYWAVRVA